MKKGAIALLYLCLVGCMGYGTTLIVLRNPNTGQVAQCQDDARLFGSAARVEGCAEAYEKLGWERVK